MAYKDPPKEHQFKPGQSGNPEGSRLHDPVKKAIKKLTVTEVKTVIEKTLSMTRDEIKAIEKKQDATVLEMIVASIAAKSSKGDHKAFNALLDRSIGRTKEEINVTGVIATAALPPEELKKHLDKNLQELALLE